MGPIRRTERPQKRWRDTALLLALFALVVAGLIGAAAATGWEETKAQLAKLSLWQFAVLLGLSLANYLLRGLRWHLFAAKLGLGLGIIANFIHFLGGFAMSVTPGWGGQSCLPEILPKIRRIARMAQSVQEAREAKGLAPLEIQVDGGINGETGRLCEKEGATVAVAGSFVYGAEDTAKAIQAVRGTQQALV